MKTNLDKYYNGIKLVLVLSNLFSENTAAPYLNYRLAENIYCNYIENVENLGRLDIAIDAIQNKTIGVGIKTFIHGNGNTNQKIAEFNKDKYIYDNLTVLEKVIKIAELRNKRLLFVKDTYNLKTLIYHCITRDKDKTIRFYETTMDFINIKNIKIIGVSEATIKFTDGLNEYSFNISKSTLYKRFNFKKSELKHEFKAKVAKNPLALLTKLFDEENKDIIYNSDIKKEEEYIILPLYSFNSTKGKYIPEKSGLNQWNAAGRKRNPNEVYIPISRDIHKYLENKYINSDIKFFPNRNVRFKLYRPDGKILSAKICQDNSKALMTNPNKDLGKWLLRDVLRLEEGELLTYEILEDIGIDSVKITKLNNKKIDELSYSIEFCSIGSYDEFVLENFNK